MLSNDELIKYRSRIYRGYRAPQAVIQFENEERIASITRDGSGNVTRIVHEVTFASGVTATRTTDYVIDGLGNVQSSTITYDYN